MVEETHSAPRRGLLALFLGVLLHPRRTLASLHEQGGRAWLFMALMAMLFTVLPVLVAAPVASRKAQEVFRSQMESRVGATPEMSPEQLAQAEKTAANPLFIVVLPALGTLAGLWVVWLIWAGSLHLLGTMLGGSSSFAQMLRMVVWSWLPYALRGLVQTVYILLSGNLIEHAGLSGLVAAGQTLGEAMAAPPSTGMLVLQSLLGRMDIYLFWNLALLVIGVAIVAQFARRKAALVTLGIWLVLTLLGLVPTIVAGSFARGFSGG